MVRRLAVLLLVLGAIAAGATRAAAALTAADVARYFPPPLVVGEKDDKLPIWPIMKQQAGSYEVFAYAFESATFAPIRGFGGEPIDMLVAMAPDGSFRDVKVLSQHEPVFVDGLGPEPLMAFVQQYVGMSARRTIRVGRPNARGTGAPARTVVDGVAMATASTRVINESILGAALAVARRKLGFGAGNTLGMRVTAKDAFQPMTWDQLLAAGFVKKLHVTNAEVDKAYADSELDAPVDGKPGDTFADAYVAEVDVPTIGRNLLGDRIYRSATDWLAPGDHLFMVLAAGPWSPLGDDFILGSVPDRISIQQNGLSITARDQAVERNDAGIKGMPAGQWSLLKVTEEAGLDPSQPWTLALKVTRDRGQMYSPKVEREFKTEYQLPPRLFDKVKPDVQATWIDAWRWRAWELGVIALMLVTLVPVLVRQRGLVADPRRFAPFRLAFLALTLGFVGWYSQAQLSIVTLIGVVHALQNDRDFTFLLYDPPSLLLWAFVLVSLAVWGRGTFCGWLCPFGAIQELTAFLFKPLHLPQIVVPPTLDRRLRKVKYVVLAGILVAATTSASVADRLAEVEPFKTSITLYFVRYWPFVVYAIGLIGLNLFVYKGFCRYLCPLGASLALVGRIRILNWIPRRAECGTPCQLCKVKCRYGAIEPTGKIDYPECFQCMDCVTIIHDPRQCVPQILARKKGRAPTLQPAE